MPIPLLKDVFGRCFVSAIVEEVLVNKVCRIFALDLNLQVKFSSYISPSLLPWTNHLCPARQLWITVCLDPLLCGSSTHEDRIIAYSVGIGFCFLLLILTTCSTSKIISFFFLSYRGRTIHRFIPIDKILKPVLSECVTPVTCYWSLSLIVREEEELVLVFKVRIWCCLIPKSYVVLWCWF